MSLDSMIEVRDVSKRFGSFVALDKVNVDIREGEFFSLLGPSGCGKTTLLRMIGGFDSVSSGEIHIGGKPMQNIPANRRSTNMVFQSYAIFPHLDVSKNVAYGLKRQRLGAREEARRVEEALGQVSLGHLGGRMASQLSGGQRQRVALARALVMRPKVLLLDEPLSALDKKLREQMQVELRRLQQSVGITFVLVTHDQYEALAMSDRVAVMFGGQIKQVAAPQEIYQRPATRQVADFLGGMNFIDAKIGEIGGSHVTVETETFGKLQVLKPANGSADNGKAILGIRPERIRVLWEGETAADVITGTVLERHYFGEVTHLIVKIGDNQALLTVSETNDFGADDIPVGAKINLAYERDAFVLMAE